jgi:hypothetical protein
VYKYYDNFCQLLGQLSGLTARFHPRVFTIFRVWQNVSPHTFNYFELHTAKTALGETALGEGLLYILIPSSALFVPS